MKNIIFLSVFFALVSCINENEYNHKREEFIKMAEEKGLLEVLKLNEAFPDPNLTREEWENILDQVKKIEDAYAINKKESKFRHQILNEMWEKLDQVQHDKAAFNKIYKEYAVQYDFISTAEEGNIPIPD